MTEATVIAHINLAKGFRGGERQTELLIRGLAQGGQVQRLVCRKGQPLAQRMADVPDLEVVEIDKPFIFKRGQLADCALVHAHEAKAGHLAYFAWRRYQVPYVLTRRVENIPKQDAFTQNVYRHATAVVVLSKAIDAVLRKHTQVNRVQVIPSALAQLPVDAGRSRALRLRFGEDFVVAQIGALDESCKGQQHLLAAARLLPADAGWRFLLLGNGRDEASLKTKAQGLNNVEFVGFVDNVGDYLASVDALAMPSLHEGLGSILLDAMAAGLPIVASNVGGIPDVVHDPANGFLVPPAEPEALASALSRLRTDKALRAAISKHNLAHAQNFSAEHMVIRYQALYAQLLGRP